MDHIRTKLVLTAISSRLFLMLLSFFSNLLIPDHDAHVFLWTPSKLPNSTSWTNYFVLRLTEGLTRWDGQYFLSIANHGYSYENTLAFFPLYPIFSRLMGEFIFWLQVDYELINFPNALRLGAITISLISFIGATLMLFELSRKVLRDDYMAYKSALIFTINPASIFFTSTYSESLYSFFTFYALVKLEKGFTIKMVLAFAMATATRSNAVLNTGFILYKGLKIICKEIVIHQRLRQLERSELSETIANIIGDAIVPSVLSSIFSLLPFVLFQWYAFTEFCSLTKPKIDYDQSVIDYAAENHLRLPSSEPAVWCHERIPLAYSYIQSHYWEVGGFGNYFEFKQIPNFLLAFPIIFITLYEGSKFLKFHRFYSVRLGCTYFSLDPAQQVPKNNMYSSRILPKECFVYIVHAMALSVFCFFFVHVQVTTRMLLSCSPVFYWIAALITTPSDRRPCPVGLDLGNWHSAVKLERGKNLESFFNNIILEERLETKEAKWIKTYCIIYCIVGTVLFSNFLPWT